jgi:hypothetical protein
VSGCAGGTDWQPRKPTESIDLSSFDARYTPVIASLTSATAGTGFTWDHAAPSNTVIAKFGICSWRLRQSGTWAGNKGQLRDLRNILNRTLVQNGFHAAAWKNESSAPLFISQDRYAALLEVTLGHPATIDIYSPAAGTTCP